MNIPPRTLAQVKDSLANARKQNCEIELARMMQKPYARLTDEALAYVRAIYDVDGVAK